jgi:hypothetical protein
MSYKYNPLLKVGLDEAGSGAGGGTPGGSNTQIQFNDSGSFGGDVDLTWNKTTNVMTVAGDVNLSDGGSFTTTLQTITPTANRTISLPNATGTVALVGGSSGQVVYNNAGAYAGVSTMTFDGTNVTLAGRLINSYNSASLSPAKVFTGTWVTGQGTTNTKPHLLIEPTGTTSTAWSNSGTGIGVNAASGFTGRLLDLHLNGSSKAAIDSSGRYFSQGNLVSYFSTNPGFSISGTGTDGNSFFALARYNSTNSFGTSFAALRSRNGTIGLHTIVQNNDALGDFSCLGSNGTTFEAAARFFGEVDGTPSATSMPGRWAFYTTPAGSLIAVERWRITNDAVIAYNQAAPISKSAAATLTVAELKTGIIQYTGAADTLTLPTGTLTEGGFSGIYTNMTFEWSVINTGSGTCTIGAGADHTIVGGATVAAGDSGRFASRRTAANTFVSYRLS